MSKRENSIDENSNNAITENLDAKEELQNMLKGKEKQEYLENTIEEQEEQKYMKLVWISMYVSFWLLSCVLLYTYNTKRGATLEYNRVMTQLNTNKLNEQIRKYDQKCKEYINLAYPSKMMSEDNEVDTSGLSKVRKDMYLELIKTIEAYDKCNYIKINTDGSPFPVSEIMISAMLLLLILSIIVVSNLTNNPFAKFTYDKEIKEIEEMVKSKIEDGVEMDDELKNKLNYLIKERDLNRGKIREQPQGPQVPQVSQVSQTQVSPQTQAQTQGQVSSQTQAQPQGQQGQQGQTRGGAAMGYQNGTKSLQETLNMLQNREIEIATRISMLKSNATFNYTSLSFCIVIFSFYISYKMIMGSIYFNENLFSGAAFMKSRCYSNQ